MLENNNINAEADELISDFTKYYTTISDNIPFGPRNNNVDNPKTFYRNQLDKVLHKQNSALYSYILGDNMTYSIDTSKVIFPFGFNESQKDAVLNALQNKISVIEGPPGTGKTQTILNIIANLVGSMNKTVGVVSLNNSAVDNVLEKLQENGYGFIAASLGSTAKKTAFFEHLPTFDSSTFNSDPVKAQAHLNYTDLIDLMKLFNKKAKLKYTLSEFKLEQEHFTAATLNENFKKIKKLPFFNMNSSELVSFMAEAQMAVISPKNKGMLYKAHLLFKYRFIDFKKLDKNYMDVISAFQKEYYNLKINEITDEINRIEVTLKNKKFDSILKNYKNWSKNVFDSLLYKRYCKKSP